MKRYTLCLLCLLPAALLFGCARDNAPAADYPAAIMAEDTIYYKADEPMPAEVDESAILGYTDSYTDAFPEKNGETNFNRELGMPYAKVQGGLAVLYENEWYLCAPEA